MTDLLSKPRTDRAEETLRPLPLAGALAGAAAAGITVVICMAVALIGWFLADAGAHGQTTDALRVGADAWLLGLGSHITAANGPIGITPLGLTGLLVLVGFRSGRWAASGAQPAEDDRSLAFSVLVCAGVYIVGAVLIAELATRSDSQASLPEAVLGALLISVLACGLGLAAGSGRLAVWLARVPELVTEVARVALNGALLLLAMAALLVAVSLLVSFNEAANVFSGLGLSFGDAIMMVLASALVAPNAALMGAAYLAGPGFAFGTGTAVTTSAVTLGPIPAFPLLAALPSDGPAPGWLVILLAVPALGAAIAAGMAQRRSAVTAWDAAALRGFAGGFGAGLIVWVLVCLAGGAMGTGRMAQIGAPVGEVLVTAVGGMAIGGLVGGLLVDVWQRRGQSRASAQ